MAVLGGIVTAERPAEAMTEYFFLICAVDVEVSRTFRSDSCGA